ncbi:MAG: cadherin-like beta sandwich domain-containing protein [bacterium]|nr:cadherin-like beta sandwich domain-containing protein [bacterium]
MKSLMGKLVAVLCICSVIMSCLVLGANAAGSTSLSFSSSKTTVGSTVTVRVNFSAGEQMYAVEGMVKYNSSVLQFVSGDNANSGAAGVVKIAMPVNSNKCSASLTFRAIGVGTSSVSVYDCLYSNAESEIAMSGSGASISVTDASKNLSSDANLKSLKPSAGTLVPAFSPNTVAYTVNVDFGVTQCLISAIPSTSDATWDVTGSKELKVGKNVRTVVVTAPNGTKKSYTITINRAAEGGESSDNTSSESETTDDTKQEINVLVDGHNKTIAQDLTADQKLDGFKLGEFVYNGTVVPAYINEKNGLTALMLSESGSNQGEFYFYQSDLATFEKVLVEKFGNKSYVILGTDGEAPAGFVEGETNIHHKTVRVYKSKNSKLSDFSLLYMINKDGEKFLYMYDAYEDTVSRYVFADTQQTVAEADQQENFGDYETVAKVLLVVSGGLLMLVITLLVLLFVKKSNRDNDDYFDPDDYDDQDTWDDTGAFDEDDNYNINHTNFVDAQEVNETAQDFEQSESSDSQPEFEQFASQKQTVDEKTEDESFQTPQEELAQTEMADGRDLKSETESEPSTKSDSSNDDIIEIIME